MSHCSFIYMPYLHEFDANFLEVTVSKKKKLIKVAMKQPNFYSNFTSMIALSELVLIYLFLYFNIFHETGRVKFIFWYK